MTMMLLAVISLAIPSTFHNFVSAETIKHEQYVNLAVALTEGLWGGAWASNIRWQESILLRKPTAAYR